MALGRRELAGYDATLSGLERSAAEYARRRVGAFLARFPDASVADAREFAKEAVGQAVDAYGDAAGAAACELYDALADDAGESLPSAAVDTSDVSGYIDREVRYQAGKLADGAPTAFAARVADLARDQVARRANSTMMKNASRDGIRYARVPMGGETCTFCAMLASRGFAYRSAGSAGEGAHWHPNCRCKVVPETAGAVEGYDPSEWAAKWRAMGEIDADPRLTAAQKLEAKGRVVESAEPVPKPSAPAAPAPKPVALAGRLGRFNARTGGMTPDEYAEYQRELRQISGYKEIKLSRAEYARVVSEINTHMSDEDRKHALVSKPIGNYRYTFINKGFDDYVFVDKVEID